MATMPGIAANKNYGSSVGGAGGTISGNANGGNAGAPTPPLAESCGKPPQELPAMTHEYAEQYAYAYPAAPPYGGPPKPPAAYRNAYKYGGGAGYGGYGYKYGGGGGYGGYGYDYPEPDGIWDEPAYGGGRYHPPQPPYYHGSGRGGYPYRQFGRGAGAGGYGRHGGGGSRGGGGGGRWHTRKHQGGGEHWHGHGEDYDGGGYDDYGYDCGRGCGHHMHMQGEFEHEEHTRIKHSADDNGTVKTKGN